MYILDEGEEGIEARDLETVPVKAEVESMKLAQEILRLNPRDQGVEVVEEEEDEEALQMQQQNPPEAVEVEEVAVEAQVTKELSKSSLHEQSIRQRSHKLHR